VPISLDLDLNICRRKGERLKKTAFSRFSKPNFESGTVIERYLVQALRKLNLSQAWFRDPRLEMQEERGRRFDVNSNVYSQTVEARISQKTVPGCFRQHYRSCSLPGSKGFVAGSNVAFRA
jgi:hypothetical protein